MISKSGCRGVRLFCWRFAPAVLVAFAQIFVFFSRKFPHGFLQNELVFAFSLWYNKEWKRNDKEGV
jgi:hypothetical protein